MTISLFVKVFDGVVLATDSATTLQLPDGGAQVYNHANKTFQLHREYPIGAVTWGLGAIGSASISTIAKDLRSRLMGNEESFSDWELDANYTLQGVAERARELLHEELYSKSVVAYPDGSFPTLGFLIAGFSGSSSDAEVWRLEINDPNAEPDLIQEMTADQSGWAAFGQPGALMRLFDGVDPFLADYLGGAQVEPPTELPHVTVDRMLQAIREDPVVPPMPFQDAINLAQFMVDTTVGYTRYILGPDTVGGEVEVAGISRHEGFKWVRRKHYFSQSLNPKGHSE